MDESPSKWLRVAGLLAVPATVVLLVPLAILLAFALYARALALALWMAAAGFRRRLEPRASALPDPHFAQGARKTTPGQEIRRER